MEKMPDPVNNIDHAWVAAHGEKSLRDKENNRDY